MQKSHQRVASDKLKRVVRFLYRIKDVLLDNKNADKSCRLSAHEQIQQVSARFAHGVDRLNVDLMKSAYWSDASDDHGFFVGNAHAFCDHIISTHAHFFATMHCMHNHMIDVDEATGMARGEVYTTTYILRDASFPTKLETWWGRYLDTYERRNGEWRIKTRICVHEFTSTNEISQAMGIDTACFRQGIEDRGNATNSLVHQIPRSL